MEERLLVKRAKRGDVDAFGELYQQIYKKLYAYALYILKRPEDAEDVVGEAVVDAFATIGKLQKEDSFASWMYRIVANKCNRRMRDYYHEGEELTEQVLASTEAFADDWSDEREESMEIRNAFYTLSKEDRMIVGMHVFFGYTTREIALMMEWNENTVRSRESRALKKLSRELENLWGIREVPVGKEEML